MAKPTHHVGSFMRIEVVSMLKLATLCVGAALALLLFTVVGYSAAPPVAKSDFTSASSRCTSAFSPELLRACAADANVTLLAAFSSSNGTSSSSSSSSSGSAAGSGTSLPPSPSTTATVVEELLRLDLVDHVNVLSCMLDKCSHSISKPLSVDDPATQLQFAHFAFNISGLSHKNRYFYLEVAFPNNDATQDSSFRATVVPHVRGYYYNATSHDATLAFVDLLPDHRSLELTVHCRKSALFCESQYFLRFGEIDFVQYRVDVLLQAVDATHPLPINGRDPQFRKIWGTMQFTDWMLGIKYFFLVVSLLMVFWYNRNLQFLRAGEQNLEQHWVVALGMALVLFNDPLYYFEATMGGHTVKVLSVLFQVTFFQLLLLFWLIALDNMRLQGREAGMSNTTFFVPKITFVGLFGFVLACYHGYIKYYSNNDPLWDPLAQNHNFALLRMLAVLFSLVYLGWFAVLCVLSRHEFRSKRARYKYLLLLSLWLVVTAFLGLGSGSFSPTPASGGAWTAFVALFNLYVVLLQYLYAPSATALRTARARNLENNGDKDADPEASPALARDPIDMADDDVEPHGVELDLA